MSGKRSSPERGTNELLGLTPHVERTNRRRRRRSGVLISKTICDSASCLALPQPGSLDLQCGGPIDVIVVVAQCWGKPCRC